jgi:drug/metabolite transporter (DMT)-like permease
MTLHQASPLAESAPDARTERQKAPARGMLLGLAGVATFSLSLPMTRIAVLQIDAVLVTGLRCLGAGLLAAMILAWHRAVFPARAHWRNIGLVAAGVVVGFPLFSAVAMQFVPAAHGALVNGLLPLATALAGAWLHRERPQRAFWILAGLGSGLIMAYAFYEGAGNLQAGDLWMLAAVLVAALGYAAGGDAARGMPAWQVICWALVLCLPLSLSVSLWRWVNHPPQGDWAAWGAVAYVTVMSQLIGFFWWYAGLAAGGTGKVGQVQLLQIFMTVLASWLLFAEPVPWHTWLFAIAIVVVLYLVRLVPAPTPISLTRPAP